MNRSKLLQIFGSVAIVLLAILLAHIGRAAERYSRYGQEALLASAGFLLSVVMFRMLAVVDVMSQSDARVANGLLAFAFLAILLELMYLRHKEVTVTQGKEVS